MTNQQIKNVVLGENTDLEAEITGEKHQVYYTGLEEVEYKFRSADHGQEEIWRGDVTEVNTVNCKCGEQFEDIDEGKQHLEETPKAGQLKTVAIHRNLTGVKMYGFEFSGMEAHGGSIAFTNEMYGITLYATPNFSKEGELAIELQGSAETEWENLNGMNGQKYSVKAEGLTVREYLLKVRTYIEGNLLNQPYREQVNAK